MTIEEYNTKFYPIINNAESFVSCIDHAIEKCDDNTKMQFKVIGWNEQTKLIILDALYQYHNRVKDVMKLDNRKWWPDDLGSKEKDN